MKKVFWCKSCLNMSTRPRIEFDEYGVCNACQWAKEKRTLDWKPRKEQLQKIIQEHKNLNGDFDCIVPVSGGKDSSYVAYKIKHELGLNPLTITIRPALSLGIGEENLDNFVNAGYDNITIKPNPKNMQKIDKFGFIEYGIPMLGWQTIIQTFIPRIATNMGISLIFYGEDGEIEYGGSTTTKNQPYYTVDYSKSVYLSGAYSKILNAGLNESDLVMFRFPSDQELQNKEILCMHWSYFDPWDSYNNYLVSKEKCGLKEKQEGSGATYNNFAQNDTCLYDLHTYLMYLKFGFGRTTQDAGIDIRRGALDREQAIMLVNLYENRYPIEYVSQYLDYYEMTQSEFDLIIDKWANKDLFEKIDGYWSPRFSIDKSFIIE